jgi:hypothetical protein
MALAKIVAYLGLDDTQFGRGIARASSAASRFGRTVGMAIRTPFLAGMLSVRNLSNEMSDLAAKARETGDFTFVSERTVENIESASFALRRMKLEAAKLVSSGLDKLFGAFGKANPFAEGSRVERDRRQAEEAAALDEERLALMVKRKGGDQGELKYLESSLAKLQSKLDAEQDVLNRAKLALDVEKKRADIESVRERIAKKITDEKEREAKAAQDAAEKAQKAYEADQERESQAAQENFDRRAPLIERMRKAAVSPVARREMRKEMREQEREQTRLQKITERADWKERMARLPGNENRMRFRLTKREAMAMEANRLNQQDDAMAKSLANVDENTRKMLEALQDNLQLK